MNFEVHVTVPKPAASSIQTELESLAESLSWKTSTIEGDPQLGKGPRFYFTKHFREYTDALVMMNMLAQRLQQCGIIVLRKKIELVMFDKVNTDPEIPAEQQERGSLEA